MKNKILLLSISVLGLFSCTSTYRSGQTPDDVYYSPARYAEDKDEEEEMEESEDREIRMTIRDRRWRTLNDRYNQTWYDPYHYGYTHGYYYNPYFYPYPVHSGHFQQTNTPVRSTNLSNYYTTPQTYGTTKTGTVRSLPDTRGYNRGNNGSIRETGSGGNRTYSPSPSSSGSTRSSGSTISRPSRN